MEPRGAAHQASIRDPSVLLTKPLPTRVCRSRLAPHLYGDQEACQVNGRTYVGSLNRQVPRNEWQVRMLGAFTICKHYTSNDPSSRCKSVQ